MALPPHVPDEQYFASLADQNVLNDCKNADVVKELTDYCQKFTVPLPVKELKKILGIPVE